MRFLYIEPKYMTRQTDVQRILYANNQEDEYTVDELYHAFDLISGKAIHDLRRRITEDRWMYTPASERMAMLEQFNLPRQTIPYWELFCDFRNGGYRLLGDILCDFDDMHRGKETRKHIRSQKGDSEDLKYMVDGLIFAGDHRQELIRRCRNRLDLFLKSEKVHPHELVKYAEALGKRDFALTIMPEPVLVMASDRRGLFASQSKRKRSGGGSGVYNEIEEFNAYTQKPSYKSTGKRDTAWLGRFTFRTLLDFEGMGRILTIIARGYLYRDGIDPYENIEYARNSLLAWCSIPEKTKKAPETEATNQVNFGSLSAQFPELVDEKGNGWLCRHVKSMIKFARKNPRVYLKTPNPYRNCTKAQNAVE